MRAAYSARRAKLVELVRDPSIQGSTCLTAARSELTDSRATRHRRASAVFDPERCAIERVVSRASSGEGMCGEGMFEWPRTEGPALALELPASEAAAAAAAFSARSIARELSRRALPTRFFRVAAR